MACVWRRLANDEGGRAAVFAFAGRWYQVRHRIGGPWEGGGPSEPPPPPPLPFRPPWSRLACRGAVAFVILGCLPNRSNGGCRPVGLSKGAKKHSIAADCSELKATFGPRLRGTAKQKVKH